MACIDRDIIIYHTETKKDYDALIDDLDKKGYMWQSFMPLKIRDYWGVYQEKTCIGVRSEGKNVFCSSFSTLIHSYEIYKYEAKEDIEMKIYHTETQEDYDALMVELEEEGVSWFNGVQMTKKPDNWGVHKKHTYVRVDGVYAFYDSVYFHEWRCPDIPITTYKAKADDKMKFKKENVYKLFSQYRKCADYSLNDLQDEILKLDDKPEKVFVPKFVADWIQSYLNEGGTPIDVLGSLMSFHESVIRWFKKNSETMLKALTNGYTIEKEQLYYIPLPHLETSDGIQQVLSKRKNDTNYFASRPASALQQRFTKEELEQVPEVYKPFAKPIEEEEE